MRDHLDVTLGTAERASALLDQMTLTEKCHQISSAMPWDLLRPGGTEAEDFETTLTRPPGHVAQLILDDPAALAGTIGWLQRAFVERTRLGIPVLFHAEALNGLLAGGHMVFPTPIGLAATWSPDLVEQMAALMRRQMLRTGLRHALSPVMDVALDPRWGRVHETYGEDPQLVTAFSIAYVRGMQGADLRTGVITTGKHFLGYANPEGGSNSGAIEVGARRLRDVFGLPFEAAIRTAGLRSIMNTYSEIDGIPVAASHEILTGLLRDTFGFDGFVCADYGSIEHLVTRQEVAADPGEAGRLAITAGLDVELPQTVAYGDALVKEVEQGRLDAGVVDAAVRRVLEAKIDLGLFEHPYPMEHIDVDAVAVEGADLSAELAARSIVLLENGGVLPLAGGGRIAVVGPHADAADLQFATYTYPSWRTAVDAIHLGGEGTMVGAASPADTYYDAIFSPGAARAIATDRYPTRGLAEIIADTADRVEVVRGSRLTERIGDEEIAAVGRAAAAADLVVVAVGGASLWFNGERTEGEASDTADIALPAAQREVLDTVAASGTPYVVVLVQGRAYTLPDSVTGADAVIVSTYAGPFGPSAIGDVLFGRRAPSGKLPYSIPLHGGQIPVYHHKKVGTGYRNPQPALGGRHYLDMSGAPRYAFGHGLTYTRFTVSDPAWPEDIDTAGAATVEATVTNSGQVTGGTVLQLYARIRVTGMVRPAQQLLGFARVELAPGESARVRIGFGASLLGATGPDGGFGVDPGTVALALAFDAEHPEVDHVTRMTGPRVQPEARVRPFLPVVEITKDGDN